MLDQTDEREYEVLEIGTCRILEVLSPYLQEAQKLIEIYTLKISYLDLNAHLNSLFALNALLIVEKLKTASYKIESKLVEKKLYDGEDFIIDCLKNARNG